MKNKLGAALLAIALIAPGTPQAGPDDTRSEARPSDQQVRDDITKQARTWLLSGDFEAFDAAADRFRETQERTPAGYWKLAWLYHAANAMDAGDGDSPTWARLDLSCQQWLQRHPQSAAAVIVRAKLLLARAWAYRGTGFAGSVGDRQLKAFRTLTVVAGQVLDSHAELANRDPEWSALRITVAMAQGESSRQIFERASAALAREPLYYGIHFAAEKALEPSWGGSEEWIKRYVAMALDRSRALEGTQAYMRIYFNVAKNARDVVDALNQTGAKQPAMIESYTEVLGAYPDEHNRQIAKALMCFGGDAAHFKALGRPTGDAVPAIAWWDTAEWRRGCDQWAYEGKLAPRSVSAETFTVVSFLRGMGRDFWAPLGWAALALWLTLEGLLRLGWKKPSTDNRSAATDPYDPARYPRTYFVRWRQVALSDRAAIRLAVFGAASAWALTTVPWPDRAFGTAAFSACALAALLAVLTICRRLSTRVLLTADAVELQVLWRRQRIGREAIRGRSAFNWQGAAVALYTERSTDSPILIPEVENADAEFWQWFAPLRLLAPDASGQMR